MIFRCRDASVDLERTAVMGVLNVTPDSFSDGGLWTDPDAAIKHGIEMMDVGADVIDVGGESTRPGASEIPIDEELRRVLPVIQELARATAAPISIDTRKPDVAIAALEAGAHIVNDTAGEERDPAMGDIVKRTRAGIVVMHSRGRPDTMRSLATYDDVVHDVAGFLSTRAAELVDGGIERDRIMIDPGFGFAKTPKQNLVLLERLDELAELGFPVLAGTSRKSFIGEVLDLPVEQRIEGTIATVVWAVARGAAMVRVHDVEPIVRAVKMADAVRRSAR